MGLQWVTAAKVFNTPNSRIYVFLYKQVKTRSDTDFGNTQSAPRGGKRATVCETVMAVGGGIREAECPGAMRMGRAGGL